MLSLPLNNLSLLGFIARFSYFASHYAFSWAALYLLCLACGPPVSPLTPALGLILGKGCAFAEQMVK